MAALAAFQAGEKVRFTWGETAWVVSSNSSDGSVIVDYRDGHTAAERVSARDIRRPPAHAASMLRPVWSGPGGKHAASLRPGCTVWRDSHWLTGRRCRHAEQSCHPGQGGREGCCALCLNKSDCATWTYVRPHASLPSCGNTTVATTTAPSSGLCCTSRRWPSLSPGRSKCCDAGIAAPAEGYCDIGARIDCGGGDAHHPLSATRGTANTLFECVQRCLRCARCRFVSYSAVEQQCFRHAACDLADLRLSPADGPDFLGRFVSVQVRPQTPRAPQPLLRRPQTNENGPTSLRLAIATLFVGSGGDTCRGLGCALPQWCTSARRVAALLPAQWTVDLLVIEMGRPARKSGGGGMTPTERRTRRSPGCLADDRLDPADCPGLRLLTPQPALVRAIEQHAQRRPSGSDYSKSSVYYSMQLLKWQFFGLVEYAAILYADLDVDIFPAEVARGVMRRAWNTQLPPALAAAQQGKLRLIGNADHSSPLNGGLLIVLPSQSLYHDGLWVLRTGTFQRSTGWNSIGRPRELSFVGRHLDGAPTAYGHAATLFNETDAWQRDSWDFVAGDSDQGFLWYMCFLREGLGAYARVPSSITGQRPLVNHWWASGSLKPWQLPPGGIAAWKDNAQLGCAYEYLRRASSLTPSEQVAAQGASTCVHRLRDYRRALERDPRFANEVWPKSIARSCPGYPSFPLF